jgi:hypothetical protein
VPTHAQERFARRELATCVGVGTQAQLLPVPLHIHMFFISCQAALHAKNHAAAACSQTHHAGRSMLVSMYTARCTFTGTI